MTLAAAQRTAPVGAGIRAGRFRRSIYGCSRPWFSRSSLSTSSAAGRTATSATSSTSSTSAGIWTGDTSTARRCRGLREARAAARRIAPVAAGDRGAWPERRGRGSRCCSRASSAAAVSRSPSRALRAVRADLSRREQLMTMNGVRAALLDGLRLRAHPDHPDRRLAALDLVRRARGPGTGEQALDAALRRRVRGRRSSLRRAPGARETLDLDRRRRSRCCSFSPTCSGRSATGSRRSRTSRTSSGSGKNVVLSPPEFVSSRSTSCIRCCSRSGSPGSSRSSSGAASRLRVLGLTYLVLLALMIALKAKNYYLAPIYPMLFAAGAVGHGGLARPARAGARGGSGRRWPSRPRHRSRGAIVRSRRSFRSCRPRTGRLRGDSASRHRRQKCATRARSSSGSATSSAGPSSSRTSRGSTVTTA